MKLERVNSSKQWIGDIEKSLGLDHGSWRKRLVALAAFIEPQDRSIMDLGAGKMWFGQLLDEDREYIPVDYYKSSSDTIVCDFNKYQFPSGNADVIVASGILGYIDDVQWFLDNICNSCEKLLLSFRGSEKFREGAFSTDLLISYLADKGFTITGRDNTLEDQWSLIAAFEKMKPVRLCKQLSCTGCGACVQKCKSGALKLEFDEDGFYKPYCDEKKCIDCGACLRTCPLLDGSDNNNMKSPVCYAAWADNKTRQLSSSGGAFSVIADYIIEKGGVVYGAIWAEDLSVIHARAEEKKQIDGMRLSKYAQSNTLQTYCEVEETLKSGKLVAYVGTPCQIAGLKCFLKGTDTDNLLLIDLFCIGVPSVVGFKKYISENYQNEKAVSVKFRYKKTLGWHARGFHIVTESGRETEPHPYMDSYQVSLHSTLFRNDTCENCAYADFPRIGDISIGDFWGIDKYKKDWNDKRGTSCILVNNDKARKYMSDIESGFIRIEEVPLGWCVNNGNRIGNGKILRNKRRRMFANLLKSRSYNDATWIALTNRHDMGIVVMSNNNFGNLLTNYALYQVLSDIGYSALVITDHFGETRSILDITGAYFLKNPYQENDLYQPEGSKIDMYRLNDICGMFILGSDQVLTDRYLESTEYFTCMDWVRDEKRKITYGTSVGLNHFDHIASEERLKHLLHRFDSVSVRENEGKTVFKDKFDITADVVLDPVFLCPTSYYEKMASYGKMRIPQTGYIGAYLLYRDYDIQEAIMELSVQFTNNTYSAITKTDYICNPEERLEFMNEPMVEEWLALIKNCDFFVTDSFHGMCLAIIFKKQFCVMFNSQNREGSWRFDHLLSQLNLSSRKIESYDKDKIVELFQSRIDYNKVSEIMDKLTRNSYDWLINSIEKRMDHPNRFTDSDRIMDIVYRDHMRAKEHENKHLKTICELSAKIEAVERKNSQMVRKMRAEHFIIERNNNSTMGGTADLNIVCWGAGDLFIRKYELIKKQHKIKYVCDCDSDKWGQEIVPGIKCISPKQLSEMYDVFVLITIDNIKLAFDVVNELMKMNIYNFSHIRNWISYTERGV